MKTINKKYKKENKMSNDKQSHLRRELIMGSVTGSDHSNMLLAEIVTKNIRSAIVFEEFGLDFCCRGNRT